MPELTVAGRQWTVAAGSNLLDALNGAGVAVPYSCRAGSCHACLVQCVGGLAVSLRVEGVDLHVLDHLALACQSPALGALRRAQGVGPAVTHIAAHALHQAGMATAGATP